MNKINKQISFKILDINNYTYNEILTFGFSLKFTRTSTS